MNTKTNATKPLAVTRSATKRSRAKPKNRFQTLWDKAESIKLHNLELEESLEKLVQRISSEVGPAERELSVAMRTQIDKLIVFAGRKSLSQWQLHVLNEWIVSTTEFLDPFGLVDEALRNSLAQLQAKAWGISIDTESELSAIEQLNAGLEEQLGEFDMHDD